MEIKMPFSVGSVFNIPGFGANEELDEPSELQQSVILKGKKLYCERGVFNKIGGVWRRMNNNLFQNYCGCLAFSNNLWTSVR
ncbi:hypothetical protein [Paenibacillus sp. 1781tsa1]|uniref:hypothetical protein n=1 Tax=Paenibacillus sp. 1781tsa1 TaxID=2953810 RepID=UPI00209D8522|nr:hypothetical protein [Paenibacillus sp. 1781tsa1]MCP1182936.1 hypothetical protein [Paenibacillus sp. 1781tsa1]